VIADNGSTDDTRAVAASYAKRLPGLRIADAAGRPGRHYACNVGVGAARGRSVVFVDADDVVAPGYLAAMAAALREHPLVAARLDHAALDPEWMVGVGSAVQATGLQPGFGFLPFGGGCSLGIRRDAFDEIGGFREHATYCEDVDLCWRAQLRGHDIAYVPDAVVHYGPRPTMRGMFRQHRQYGCARALLYREFREFGMPRRSLRAAFRDWSDIIKGVVRVSSPAERARWSRRTGRAIGYLEGSVRYRVWFP
jgi:GT2 family glycosyltransferase